MLEFYYHPLSRRVWIALLEKEIQFAPKIIGGNCISLGDIVAGNSIILVGKLGFDLTQVEKIDRWCDRLMQRSPWQQTQPNDKQVEIFKQTVQALIASRSKDFVVKKITQS